MRYLDEVRRRARSVGVSRTASAVLRWPIRRLQWLRKQSLVRRVPELPSPEERFEFIFRRNLWNDPTSRSGFGSSPEATVRIRQELPRILVDFSVETLFDAPCGDFAWMRHVVNEHPDMKYIGADIVEPLIERNRRRHGGRNISFRHVDLTAGPYPPADLMLCRDCLLHLSYSDVRDLLRTFVASDIPLLMASTHLNPDGFANRDIVTGSWRRIDLFAPPFNFPRDPLRRFEDGVPPDPAREMCLWTRDQVIAALERFDLPVGGS